MKFIVNRDEFIQNLNAADSIINVKSPLAILLNVYIEAQDDGSIILLSYNGEHGVKVEAAGIVESAGKVSLLSKKLLEVVRRIPGDKIVFESKPENENEIQVHPEGADNPLFHLNGVSADAYPVFNEFNWESYIKIAQETMEEQIRATEYAVSNDMAKAAFTGTYIEEAVDGLLSFVTTDGKRLSVITREYEEKQGSVDTGIIIPQKIFKTIHGILHTGDVQLAVHNNQAFFKIGNVYIFANLVEGKFPNYKDVIPAEQVNRAVLDADSYLSAVETVSVISDPESGKIKLTLSNNTLSISTAHPIYGEARQDVDVEYKGSEISIAINFRSLIDYLKVVAGRKIEMVVNSQSSPVMLKVIGDDQFVYITMPMKLND